MKEASELQASPYMFVDKNGQAFEDCTFTTYWYGLLRRLGCKQAFPPSWLRHIFVDERRSKARVEGPSDVGASQVMGNSVAQWDKTYDLEYDSRNAQEAVNAMDKWRGCLLGDVKQGGEPSLSSSCLGPREEVEEAEIVIEVEEIDE